MKNLIVGVALLLALFNKEASGQYGKQREQVWRLTWYNGAGYGIDYGNGKVTLVKTTDGKAYTRLAVLDIDDSPNESTIRFDKKGTMYLLVRRESGDKKGVLATTNHGDRTGIIVTDLNGKAIKTLTLQSSGDCSYPGMI